MGWKCAPQVKGLVRGEPKPGQKHRANGMKICREAGYERASKSATLDRSRSRDNVYEGYVSGETCWGDMVAQASMYRCQVRGKTKSGEEVVYERDLRSDAVIGYAVIYNPPGEVTAGWTDEDYAKFYADSRECMELIEPRIFRKDTIRMSARHMDEGVPRSKNESPDNHLHDIGDCIDAEGHYCGNLIDAKLMDRINRNYPRLMRERGWAMEDLDVTDWEESKKNKQYRLERNAKRRKNGRSVNRYMVDKLREQVQSMDDALDAAEEMKADAETALRNASTEAQKITEEAEQKKTEAAAAAELTVNVAQVKAEKMKQDAQSAADLMQQNAVAAAKIITNDAEQSAAQTKQNAEVIYKQRITDAEQEITKMRTTAEADAQKIKTDAETIAKRVKEAADTYAAQRKESAEVAYKKKIEDADKQISEKRKELERQRLADEAKRKAENEERQAYLARLAEHAQQVHRLSGADEELDLKDADQQKVQDKLLDDYQRWQDSLEAQERAVSKEKAAAEERKVAYEAARKGYEEETSSVRAEKAGNASNVVIDFLAMLQEIHSNETIKKAAEMIKNTVKKSAGKLDEYFMKWKERNAAQRRNRINSLESSLRTTLQDGKEYE